MATADATPPVPRVETPATPVGRAESRLIAAGYVLYVVGLLAYFAVHGQFPTPDLLVLAMLPLVFLMGRWKAFVIDWLPFLALALSYEFVRGLIYQSDAPVHLLTVVHLEERLFGSPIPTIRLQQWLTRDQIMPWDIAASTLYMLHFVVPVAVAFWFWRTSRARYWRYVLGVLLLSYLGFATYALYPQEPPWLAASQGYLPPIREIFVRTLQEFTLYRPFHSAYEFIDPNPVAAMPSLHAAFPVYTYLALARTWRGWRAALAVLYPLAVIVAVVYLGHHFVVDCIAGAAYAIVCFWLVWDAPRQSHALRAWLASRWLHPTKLGET